MYVKGVGGLAHSVKGDISKRFSSFVGRKCLLRSGGGGKCLTYIF